MATVSAHSSVVKGATASPGSMPAAAPLVAPRQALSVAQTTATSPPASSTSAAPGSNTASGVPSSYSKSVRAAMQVHYRDQIHDSAVTFSPAWKDARTSIRFINHLSPLLLGVIQRPGSSADIGERKTALAFLTSSTDALSKVMADRLAPNQPASEYELLELNSMLTHLVGKMWEKSVKQDPQHNIDQLLMTVADIYADPDFLHRHDAVAERMVQLSGYLKVDSRETMDTRLRLSLHQAAMRFYNGVADDRLSNGKGMVFSYGVPKVEVVKRMATSFDGVMAGLVESNRFADSLSNDHRTTVMQTWMRNASEIFEAEYVAQTIHLMDWFRAGQAMSGEEFSSRFAQTKALLPDVISKVVEVTSETMRDLIAVAQYQGEHPGEDMSEAITSAPR